MALSQLDIEELQRRVEATELRAQEAEKDKQKEEERAI